MQKVTVMIILVNGAAPTVALTCVAAANMNGQGPCGAEGGRPAVNYQDW